MRSASRSAAFLGWLVKPSPRICSARSTPPRRSPSARVPCSVGLLGPLLEPAGLRSLALPRREARGMRHQPEQDEVRSRPRRRTSPRGRTQETTGATAPGCRAARAGAGRWRRWPRGGRGCGSRTPAPGRAGWPRRRRARRRRGDRATDRSRPDAPAPGRRSG